MILNIKFTHNNKLKNINIIGKKIIHKPEYEAWLTFSIIAVIIYIIELNIKFITTIKHTNLLLKSLLYLIWVKLLFEIILVCTSFPHLAQNLSLSFNLFPQFLHYTIIHSSTLPNNYILFLEFCLYLHFILLIFF